MNLPGLNAFYKKYMNMGGIVGINICVCIYIHIQKYIYSIYIQIYTYSIILNIYIHIQFKYIFQTKFAGKAYLKYALLGMKL